MAELLSEFQGGAPYAGDANTVAAMNKPFWVQVGSFDGTQYYDYTEVVPDSTGTSALFTIQPGGRTGTTTNGPLFEANNEFLPPNVYVLARLAHFDPVLNWTYVAIGPGICCMSETAYTVPAFTTDQNNVDVTSNWSNVFLISSTVPVSVTGLVPPFTPSSSQVIVTTLINTGTQPITLTFNDTSSTLANRFLIDGGQPVILQQLDTATIVWTSTLGRWLLTSTTGNLYPDGLPQLISGETPSGTVNGTNPTFTLSKTPVGQRPGTTAFLDVTRNGVLQTPTSNYTFTGSTITFQAGAIPLTGDILRTTYWAVVPTTYSGLFTTTSTVASSLNPSTSGASVTFTLTTTYAGGVGPTGTTEFFDGVTSLGAGSTPSGSGGVVTSTLATSALAIGAHSITGVFTGTGGFSNSTSPAITQTVSGPVSLSASYATTSIGSTASILVPSVVAVIGDLIVVIIAIGDTTTTVSGVDWGGNAATDTGVGAGGGLPYRLREWRLIAPSSGTHALTVALSGAISEYVVTVAVFHETSGSGFTYVSSGNPSGTGTVATTGGSSQTAGQVGVMAVIDDANAGSAGTATWSGGYTRVRRDNSGAGSMDLDVAWSYLAASGTDTPTLTYGASVNWAMQASYYNH